MPKPHRSDAPAGLGCPRCGCRDLRVVRCYDRPGYRRRLKECRHCGARVFTTEKLAPGSGPAGPAGPAAPESAIDSTFPPPPSLS